MALCAANAPITDGFPSQSVSYAEKAFQCCDMSSFSSRSGAVMALIDLRLHPRNNTPWASLHDHRLPISNEKVNKQHQLHLCDSFVTTFQ